jgi:hypothetical protein
MQPAWRTDAAHDGISGPRFLCLGWLADANRLNFPQARHACRHHRHACTLPLNTQPPSTTV